MPDDGLGEWAGVHGVVVRPGDGLVVAVPLGSTADDLQRLKEALAERLPDVAVTVVAANQLVVYRPGG